MSEKALPIILWTRLPWRVLLLLFSFLSSLFGLLAPYFQKEFVDHLTGTPSAFEIPQLVGATSYFLIVLAFACLLLSQALNQLTNYLGSREAVISQRHLAQMLYEKTLSLKVDSLSSRPVGEIVSLYATDVPGSTILLEQTLPQGSTTFFPLILAPLALSFLMKTPILPTVLIMLAVSILNTALAFRQSKFFFRYKQIAAERIGLVNEWITQLRGLRILGWIDAFEDRIYHKREVETKNRIEMVTNGQVMNSISSSMTFAMNVVALGTMTLWQQSTPSSGEILASLWILGVFLTRPFRQMPWFFTFAFDGWTSIKRLDGFLSMKNLTSPPALTTSSTSLTSSEPPTSPKTDTLKTTPALALTGLNLQLAEGKPLLNNLSFQIQPGEFVALVGEVGSGKSLFLLSLLRETGADFRTFELDGRSVLNVPPAEIKSYFSYVPQESFIMSATLAQNVYFDYRSHGDEPSFLTQALQDSQFDYTQERLPLGLRTNLGERGVNLSGGQRLRVSLARAAAKEAEILLIDDGFSNLDVKTEEALLKSLFFGRWKNKTKILATHRLTVLPYTDRILFMKKGEIINQGRYKDLIKTDVEFKAFVQSLTEPERIPNV
ncbi:MAG: ABC transporter ATP-binding protein [Bdellovibrionaceae bacterium]|nr:ABC transporter ATP-binding protein [Pseudobdellovibrionaceae bacterium]